MKIIIFFSNKILDPHPTQPVISTQWARNIEISDTSYSIQLLHWYYTNDIWGLITVSWSSENWAYNDQTVISPFNSYI